MIILFIELGTRTLFHMFDLHLTKQAMQYAWALFLNKQGIVTVINTSLLPLYLNCK